MDESAHLRRTVRRCTAVLVAVIGVAIATLAGSTNAPVGVFVSAGALLYLGGSLVYVPASLAAADGEDGQT